MHGCAMGSPVSPIVVNLYMEKFENKALSTFNDTPPANWFRYVDDTWCRLKKRVAADFFDHINQIDDNIKFTQEPSHDNMLPFLDTKTIVEEDGNLRFEVYRKPTHTDQYLAFDSHHPLEHKLAVIKTLFHRADNIVTSDQAKTDEHRHLRGALAKCGYQNWTFNKALKPSDQSKKTQKCKPLTNKNKANITILYVQGVSEKLRRIFQNFNIATNFKPHSTLRQRLVHPKDRPHKGTKANVIYRLKCEEPNCNNTYIGETSRPLKASCSTEPSASGSMSAAERRAQRMAKLQELSLKRNEARKMNHQEVVEEDRRNKLPANFEQKRKREEWKEEEEKKRKEAEEKGEDYDRLRMLEWTAEEVEKWERKKKKKNPDPGFSTYEAAGLRQYQALTKKMKPNMEHYQQQKEKMGEEFYPDMNTLVDVTRKDSEEAVDRLVADVEKHPLFQLTEQNLFRKPMVWHADTVASSAWLTAHNEGLYTTGASFS
ncbi:uncharacterized protein LOC144925962 isoform X2 [Branchiostoma floridae x Branchiostoma belcheri]